MSSQGKEVMSDDKALKHFEKFNGIRPKHISPTFPMYSPERDFCQNIAFINKLWILLHSVPMDYWQRFADQLGVQLFATDGGEVRKPSEEVKACFRQIVAFIEDAFGRQILEDSGNEQSENLLSFDEALKKLRSGENQSAMFVLMAAIGSMALDALFYGSRQDSLIGRTGKYTMDDVLKVAHLLSECLRDEERSLQVQAGTMLEEAVRFAYSVGFTTRQISLSVDKELVAIVDREREGD